MQAKIFIAEDDPALLPMVVYNLQKEGFLVREATDGEKARIMLNEERPDLAILDWMMPHLSGFQLCKYIRRSPELRDLPVIMLSARGEQEDRIRGLDAGADDYVGKPFSPCELIARVRALLRRSKRALNDTVLRCGDVMIDLACYRVKRGKRTIHLGPTEFRLLRHFMENPGRVYSREQILNTVWGQDIYVEERTVDTHIRRLRRALNPDGKKYPNVIRTVRAVGYALDDGLE